MKCLRGSLSLLKLHAVQIKISPYTFFLENFKKCPEKKNFKTFRKIINRAYYNEYFYRYILEVDKTSLQISFKVIFFKML